MTKNKKFDNVVSTTLESCKQTLLVKGREYRRNNNPFHNFDRGVQSDPRKSREEVIWGMALKHHISVMDMIDDVKEGIKPSEEIIDEKFGDYINYLLIMKASIKDKVCK